MADPNDFVQARIDDYLHGLLSPAETNYVERHLEGCPACQAALEEARRRLRLLESVPAREASEPLIQATLARVAQQEREEQRWRRVRRRLWGGALAATATAALVLLGFQVHFANLQASPVDLEVFGQSELLAGSEGSLRVRLVNFPSQTPLAGVPVDIELRNAGQAVPLAQFKTNAQGSGQPRFRLPDWADGRYELCVTARPSGAPEVITRTVHLKRSWKLMLSSDKPVYQPGQTVHLRGLALHRPDLKPVAGHEAVFTLADPKGTILFKQKGVTSRFGISAADCPLATEILEGPYAIACKVGDTESKLTVDVKKYVLPKFQVALTLDRPYYAPGQTVTGTVRAGYFFGKPVADAVVEVKVETTGAGRQPLGQRERRTNAQGEATFEFALPAKFVGREQDSGDARVSFQAVVRDPAGQTQTKTESRVVTAQPLKIEIIPEAGSLVQGLANRVYLFTTHADGRPAPSRLKVSGVDRELRTNSLGVASFELTPQGTEIDLTVEAGDDSGFSSRKQAHLVCGESNQAFLVRTDKAVYTSGETMRLVVLGGDQQPVFVDLLKDGQTVLTTTLELKEGRGEYALDLPAELFGTLELVAYRFGPEGLPVRKSRALYVKPVRQLNLRATLNQAEYRPGQRAKLQFVLTDSRGKPAPGAVSLATVDEAVFSVLNQAPGMEQTFYTLDQELLKPVYAVYPWSPLSPPEGRPEERQLFEQALFARTTDQGGKIDRDTFLRGLLPYLENDPRIFRVLERPDWERLIDPSFIPKEARAILRNEVALHTLNATTYLDKVSKTEALKRSGLQAVNEFWIVFAVVIGVMLFAYFCTIALREGVVGCLIIAGISISLFFLMLPATQKVRESSARTIAANNMKQIGIAIYSLHDAYGVLPPAASPAKPDVATEFGSTKPVPDGAPPRVREFFPETLLWRPELITDDQGRVSLDFDLADSITTWRLTASAVSADGQLGALQQPLKVFQPFFVDVNLPVALTRSDEVAVPVVVYNYLDRPQTVELALADAPWFALLEEAGKRLELAANEVRSTSFRLRVRQVGLQHLQVSAKGSGVADAVKREIEVVPDGRRVERVFNGSLQQPAALDLTVPADAVEGSPRAVVKIYPSAFSQLVEGLDNIFQMPSGCFEQTSSTTYPNVLALDYLRATHQNVPAVEAKARQYIHLGYQRLVSFEVPGGGFDWFGRPPASVSLTAYGLMEFQDMAKVHDVDPALIERTRQWLLKQRQADGSWSAGGKNLHGSFSEDRYTLTAYVAWAVFGGQPPSSESQATLGYLVSTRPEAVKDPYTLALVCNALAALDPSGDAARPYLARLDSLKQSDGKRAWWPHGDNARTLFYGGGQAGSIETTALAVLALVPTSQYPETIRGALTWLTEQKDPHGTWHSTQATVLALKALLAGTGKALGGDKPRHIEITLDDQVRRKVVLPPDQGEVMHQLDLSEHLGKGAHHLTLVEKSGTGVGYQVAFRYHVPDGPAMDKQEPLAINLKYDRSELSVNDTVTVTATVINRRKEAAPMVLLDLPLPAGFSLVAEDLEKYIEKAAPTPATISKYQITPRSAIVYLRDLAPGKPLTLTYRLRATMPVKVSVPPAQVYEYYAPERRGSSAPMQLTVASRK